MKLPTQSQKSRKSPLPFGVALAVLTLLAAGASDAHAQSGTYEHPGGSALCTFFNGCGGGSNADASRDHGTAIGDDAKARGQRATAVGGGSEANGDDTTAIGYRAQADGPQSIMIGSHAQAISSDRTTPARNIGIGYDIEIAQGRSHIVAIGSEAGHVPGFTSPKALATGSVVIGRRAATAGDNSIALGNHAHVGGSTGIAVGSNSLVMADNAIAIGRSAVAGGGALQGQAANQGTGGIAVGYGSLARSANTVAIGSTAVAGRNEGGAVRHREISQAVVDRLATAENAVALGRRSRATGANSIVIGEAAEATATNSIALGRRAMARGENSVAIGASIGIYDSNIGTVNEQAGAQSSALNSIAIGHGSSASAEKAIAVGRGSTASVADAIAIGAEANAGAMKSIAIGTRSGATFLNSFALGVGAATTRDNQFLFGTTSSTYTLPGIHSEAGRAAQSGDLELVVADRHGSLGTDGGGIFGRIATLEQSLGITPPAVGSAGATAAAAQTRTVAMSQASEPVVAMQEVKVVTMSEATETVSMKEATGTGSTVVMREANQPTQPSNIMTQLEEAQTDTAANEARIKKDEEMVERNAEGVAVAMSVYSPPLLVGRKFSMTLGYGHFESGGAVGLSSNVRVNNDLFLSLGAGLGLDHSSTGARAAITFTK